MGAQTRRSLEEVLEEVVCRFLKTGKWEPSVREALGLTKDHGCPEVRQWKNHPYILRRLAEVRSAVARKTESTIEDHLNMLATIRDEAREEGKFSAAVQAEVSRGRALGFYEKRDERVIEGESTRELSTDDLQRRLERLEEMEKSAHSRGISWDGNNDVEDAEIL